MNTEGELEKAKSHIIVSMIEYVPNEVVSKTIIKKTTGDITVSSFGVGAKLSVKTSRFDNYIEIIDGSAELTINDKLYPLQLGEGIIIPAHATHGFNATEQFKMIRLVSFFQPEATYSMKYNVRGLVGGKCPNAKFVLASSMHLRTENKCKNRIFL